MNSVSVAENGTQATSAEVCAADIRDRGQLLLREIEEVESYMSKFKIETLKLRDFKKDIASDLGYTEKVCI